MCNSLGGAFSTFYDYVLAPLAELSASQTSFCYGDFYGSDIIGTQNVNGLGNANQAISEWTYLNDAGCTKMPLSGSATGDPYYKYGFVTMNIPYWSSTGSLLTPGFCLAMRPCDATEVEFNFVFNMDTITTMGDVIGTPSVKAACKALAMFDGYFGFGVSTRGDFEKAFVLYHPGRSGSSGSASTSSGWDSNIVMNGHAYVAATVAIPLPIEDPTLKEMIKVEVDMLMMAHFGNPSAVSTLFDFSSPTLLTDIVNAGPSLLSDNELLFHVTGYVKIDLGAVSNGWLAPVYLSLGQANMYFSSGDGGSTGLAAGVYMSFDSDVSDGIGSFLKSICKGTLEAGLKALGAGFKCPTFSGNSFDSDPRVGMYLLADGDFGLQIDNFPFTLGMTFDVTIKVTGKKFSIKVSDFNFQLDFSAVGEFIMNALGSAFGSVSRELAKVGKAFKNAMGSIARSSLVKAIANSDVADAVSDFSGNVYVSVV